MSKKLNLLHIVVKKTLKLEYKPNIRKATAVVISKFAAMLFANQRKLTAIINKVVDFIKDFKSPVRKNRAFKRAFNYSKHAVNYKRNTLICLS